MIEIIGVRFNDAGKIYYFAPNGATVKLGDRVIVETARGVEIGKVSIENKEIKKSEIVAPLKNIIRIATKEDLERAEENKRLGLEAHKTAVAKIHEHKLSMKLVNVEYTFDRSKILFYFTADGRVDFRDLVKTLAGIFKTRIELRQIGVRDEAKNMGSVGVCGRKLCCSSFLDEFQPVSIKMAKEQGLSLNPTKISGVCGRLMCCLQYEQEGYEEMLKIVPPRGSIVETEDGRGTIIECFTLKGLVKVKVETKEGSIVKIFPADSIKLIKKAREEKINNMEHLKNIE